ncbi:MAG: ATP-dependent zinc metalloprotease FtsH [Phycisphaeraceae bacterium]
MSQPAAASGRINKARMKTPRDPGPRPTVQDESRPDRMPDKPDDQKPDDEKQEEQGKGASPKPNNPLGRWSIAWALLLLFVLVMIVVMSGGNNEQDRVTFNTFLAEAEAGHFEDNVYQIKDNRFSAKLKDTIKHPNRETSGGSIMVEVPSEVMDVWDVKLQSVGADPAPKVNRSGTLVKVLINLLWLGLFIFVIWFFFFRALRGAGGGPGGMLGNFGRSKHKVLTKEHSTITLDDVAGIQEAKDEVGEIIEFLKNPKKFQRLGGRVPRGVLLIGPPGCGKTLLAKAVAGEADVPFFSISGSDFVEMFVGVGASRVRDLFKQAKDTAPCIIFLDEIDAVGRRRGSGFSSGGHDEREQTLNAILVEMDGFDSSDQVIVLASTNRADVLDPALTRPGRFDRSVQVHLPDVMGRAEILKVHSRKIKMSPDVDLEQLARGTPMFSGAELEAIINEAAIAATLQDKDWVEMEDLEEARDKVKYGRSRKSARVEEDDKRVVAYHEAGHAVVIMHQEHAEPLHKVTIIPRGQTGGTTFMLPERDRMIYGKRRLLASMRVAYGGRIAEQMFCDDQYNGTAGDIRQATSIARAMVTEYGMSERVGFQLFAGDDDNPYQRGEHHSDDTTHMIDQEVKRLIDETYQETLKIIEDHKDQVVAIAEALLKYETLTADEVGKLMKGESLGKTTVSDLLAAEREKAADTKPADTKPAADDDGGTDTGPGMMPSPA